jgi:hypothetical protein
MLKLPKKGLDVENHAFSVSSVLAIKHDSIPVENS